MAYATITFESPFTDGIKFAPVGFSWTSLFLGYFPPLFRGHIGGAAIIMLLHIPTLGLSSIIFGFIYNRMYIRHLIKSGFVATGATQDIHALSSRLKLQIPMAPGYGTNTDADGMWGIAVASKRR